MGGKPGRRGAARAAGLVAGLALGALTLGGAQAAATRTASAFDGAQLGVDFFALTGHSFLALSVNLQSQGTVSGDAPSAAAAVQIGVPAGV